MYVPASHRQGQVLRIEIARARPLNAGSIDCTQLYLHGARETGDDLVLHLQQIGAIGIELIGPQMRAGLGVDELGVDPHLIAAALYAALQHIAHAQILADRLDVHRLALVGEGGVARDHETCRGCARGRWSVPR